MHSSYSALHLLVAICKHTHHIVHWLYPLMLGQLQLFMFRLLQMLAQTVTDACSDRYKCLLRPLEVLMFRHYRVHAQTVTGAHYRGSCSDRYRCCNRMSRQKIIRLPVSIGSQWRKCKLKREQYQRETQSNKKSDQFKRHYQMHAHDK